MIIFKSISFYLAILGILLAILFSNLTNRKLPTSVGVQMPAKSPFEHFIAASGIVESLDKNLVIGSPEDGIVQNLWVSVGDHVKKGDPLFQIDSRSLEARLEVQKAQVNVKQLNVKKQASLFDSVNSVKDPRSVSTEDYRNRKIDLEIAEAQLKTSLAEEAETEKLIDRLIVRAPKDGFILKENIRVGEYVTKNTTEFILGDAQHLQIRVDIDEHNATQFNHSGKAFAFPKNNNKLQIPLKFVRVEPYIIPKKSLTGSSEERVDTRVLQVIYSFVPPPNYQIYIGLQVDVYIEKKNENPT